MKNSYILFLLAFAVLSTPLLAQRPNVHRCAYDEAVRHRCQQYPGYADALRSAFERWSGGNHLRGGDEVYVLPVVFHVVYNTDAQNVPDSVILSQLEVLNEDYRRLNADAAETRDIFLPFAADCLIEFELAAVDPNGNPTTGITHTFTDRTGFSLDIFSQENTLDEVKHAATGGVDAWDPEHYINVWVCNIEAGFLGQIFGLAYPPAGLDNWPAGSAAPSPGDEGVIIHYTTAGRNNPFAGDDDFDGNDRGRTLSHEMGHYLGLRHTWGDALPFFEDGCAVDDGITDTPNTATGDQFMCNYESNSCETDLEGDLPDMIENYMDYTPDDCLNMFTNEQASLMRFVIEELRPGLLDGVGIASYAENRWNMYPNPAADVLVIETTQRGSGNVQVSDASGRTMVAAPMNGLRTALPIQHLAPGLYFVRVNNGAAQRLVVN